jgi:alpha-tubulin suppressor-like RCC1 family protein
MELNPVAGRLTTRSRRRATSLILGGLIAALTMAIAVPAQAHEPYSAWAWGSNWEAQLGDGTHTGPEKCGTTMEEACSTTPVQVSKLSGVTGLAGGRSGAIALLKTGTAMTWGGNLYGELGDGSTSGPETCEAEEGFKVTCSASPVAVVGLTGLTAVASGELHHLALTNETVMAWGYREGGELGDGKTSPPDSDVPVSVCATGESAPCANHLEQVTAIASRGYHNLALLKNGKVVAWGGGASGQLGNGKTVASDTPVEVQGLSEEVKAIAGGGEFSLALLKSGKVMAWGSNRAGQLGDAGTKNSDVPVEVKGLSEEAVAISAGSQYAMALLKSGMVMAWGDNQTGELGQGPSAGPPGPETCGEALESLPCTTKPLVVKAGAGVVAISAGSDHALALLSDGRVEAWGKSSAGQLGNGTSTGPEVCRSGGCSTTPVEVKNLGGVKGIATGEVDSYAFGPTPPIVTAVSPKQGAKGKGAGTSVTITGAEFEEATEVKFGSAKATSFTVNSEGSITAVAPAGKGIVDVTVTTPAGTSATGPTDNFYYEPPTIKKLSPRKGPELGGTEVTITGLNFTGATAVKFDSTEAKSFKVNSATSITAVSPAHAGGKVDVTVATSNGTSAISGKDRFRYR